MATTTLQAHSACANPHESDPFRLVGDMEDDVRVIRDLLTGLCRMADSFEEDGEAIATIALLARDQCGNLEKRRCELFRLTHPRRAELDKEGWPGERAEAVEHGLSRWAEALLSLKCADDLLEASGGEDAEVDSAANLQHEALLKLLTLPAPDAAGLAHKLEVFGRYQGWGLTEAPDIVEVLNADAARILAAPRGAGA